MFRCVTCVAVLEQPTARRCPTCGQSLRRRPARVLGEERHEIKFLPVERAARERAFGSTAPPVPGRSKSVKALFSFLRKGALEQRAESTPAPWDTEARWDATASAETQPIAAAPAAVGCPHCGVGPGEDCKTRSNRRAHAPHVGRLRLSASLT
jgi:predicted RNA-binding Zn-ribbon protein involved in translation (DUF1610 family)